MLNFKKKKNQVLDFVVVETKNDLLWNTKDSGHVEVGSILISYDYCNKLP